ncbi:MAG: S16 family serine protease [Candidatus Altiarchaeota archaeon]
MRKIYIAIALISYIIVFILGFIFHYLIYSFSEIEKQNEIEGYSINNNTQKYESFNGQRNSLANIVAVTNYGEGILGKVNVEIREGRGRVLIETNPFTEPDIQFSVETASKVAQDFTKISIKDKDIILSFDVRGKLIGGGSAGAAITSAIIAAIQNRKVRDDVVITGTIEANGNIGKVSGILEKMQAASENNIKFFLLPKGQRYLTVYELKTKTERRGNFIFERRYYSPVEIDLKEFAEEELNMTVIEISNIKEAVKYLLL